MIWIIPAQHYLVWETFSLDIKYNLTFETGNVYHLNGNNGSGKTSFIQQVLIPILQTDSEQQYIFYVEQQIQSQFDAITSYALFQKPSTEITSFDDMVLFMFEMLQSTQRNASRPSVIILDECPDSEELQAKLRSLSDESYCLIVVSHKESIYIKDRDVNTISFNTINMDLSEIGHQ